MRTLLSWLSVVYEEWVNLAIVTMDILTVPTLKYCFSEKCTYLEVALDKSVLML